MNNKELKQQLLNQLYSTYTAKDPCHLGFLGRKSVVYGEGNPDAKLMFIGEAPGAQEDEQGRPFVGRSGQLLNKIFSALEINRAEDLYITNIIKCRPPNNRKPTLQEMHKGKEMFLLKQIKIIQPRVICTLGAAALEGLLERPVQITKQRGRPLTWNGITIFPTYHPAYILRNPKEITTFFNDLEQAWELSQLKP